MKLTPAQRYLRNVARKPAASEHALQAAIIRWCRGVGAGIVQERFASFANGWYVAGAATAVTRAIQGKKLKDEGVRAGMVDIVFYAPVGRALWMEVKLGTVGVVSPVQKVVHESLRQCGHEVVVCRNLAEAVGEIVRFYRPGTLEAFQIK